jgi:hypothetical protein
MGEPHLRRLTNRARALPQRLEARRGDWHRAAGFLAAGFSDLLKAEVRAGEPALSAKSDAQARTRVPAVLVPLSIDGAARGHAFFDEEDVRVLSALVLREEVPEPSGPDRTVPILEALLMVVVCRTLTEAVGRAFETKVTAGEGPLTEWPRGGLASALLAVTLPMLVGERTVTVRLYLPEEAEAFALREERPAPSPALARAVWDAPAQLSAVLDSWPSDASEAASLRPGTVLPLPGASVEMLDLLIERMDGARRIGTAELGRAKGRRAVRLTGPLDLG